LLALTTFRVPAHLVTRHFPLTQPLFLTFMLNFSVPDAVAELLHAYFLPARALYDVLLARESLYCPRPLTFALVLHFFFLQRFWKLQAFVVTFPRFRSPKLCDFVMRYLTL